MKCFEKKSRSVSLPYTLTVQCVILMKIGLLKTLFLSLQDKYAVLSIVKVLGIIRISLYVKVYETCFGEDK